LGGFFFTFFFPLELIAQKNDTRSSYGQNDFQMMECQFSRITLTGPVFQDSAAMWSGSGPLALIGAVLVPNNFFNDLVFHYRQRLSPHTILFGLLFESISAPTDAIT
jgi:hypothetical protein